MEPGALGHPFDAMPAASPGAGPRSVVGHPELEQRTLAVVLFLGISCAAATSVVFGDVEAGDHPTYTTTFTVTAPEPTI